MTSPPSYESVVDEDRRSTPQHTDATQTLLEKMGTMTSNGDIEAQPPRSPTESEVGSGKHAAEYRVPTRTKYMYLGIYFGLNLGLTLFNKAILGKVRAFQILDESLGYSLWTCSPKCEDHRD